MAVAQTLLIGGQMQGLQATWGVGVVVGEVPSGVEAEGEEQVEEAQPLGGEASVAHQLNLLKTSLSILR